MSEKKYYIELSEKQLDVIQDALEFFSRFCSGQTKYLPRSLEKWLMQNYDVDDFVLRRDKWEKKLDEVSALMFDVSPNQSKNFIEEADTAYDMYRPILEEFAKKNNATHSVYNFEAPKMSKEGRIEVKKLNNEK